LWKFILRHERFSKAHNTNFRFLALTMSSSRKRIVSSSYCSIERPRQPSEGPNHQTYLITRAL
jgi:hypothetical protein